MSSYCPLLFCSPCFVSYWAPSEVVFPVCPLRSKPSGMILHYVETVVCLVVQPTLSLTYSSGTCFGSLCSKYSPLCRHFCFLLSAIHPRAQHLQCPPFLSAKSSKCPLNNVLTLSPPPGNLPQITCQPSSPEQTITGLASLARGHV